MPRVVVFLIRKVKGITVARQTATNNKLDYFFNRTLLDKIQQFNAEMNFIHPKNVSLTGHSQQKQNYKVQYGMQYLLQLRPVQKGPVC